MARSHQKFLYGSSHEIAGDYVKKIGIGPPLFTLLQPELSRIIFLSHVFEGHDISNLTIVNLLHLID